MTHPYEIVYFANGTASLRPLGSSEAMHSMVGPWDEANRVYVEQSRFKERLSGDAGSTLQALVLYDVGMGIAANALAAIEMWEASSARRPLHIVSFENDLLGLRTALAYPNVFPFISRHRERLEKLLEDKLVEEHSLRWELKEGDFNEYLEGVDLPSPELIYYDFYSPAVCPHLWTVECFSKLRARVDHEKSVFLATYCASTSIRVAMLLAGFSVGHGASTKAKLDTTVAALRREELVKADAKPLGREWFAKFERSSRQLPPLWSDERRNEVRNGVRISLGIND